jgi:hypothetical protein
MKKGADSHQVEKGKRFDRSQTGKPKHSEVPEKAGEERAS